MPRKAKENTVIEENEKKQKKVKKDTKKKEPSKKETKKQEKVKKGTNKKEQPKKEAKKQEKTKKDTKKKAVSKDKKTTASKTNPKTKTDSSAKKTSKTSTKKTVNSKISKTKSSSKTTSNSNSKKSVSKKTNKKAIVNTVEYYDLPYRYNQTIVKILAQTPKMLFIYWDISDKDRKTFIENYGDDFFNNTKPVLLIHNQTNNYTFEVEINDFANSWYLHINDTSCNYSIELGRRPIQFNEKINTDYIYITSSNVIETPNDHILFDKNQNMVYFKNTKTNMIIERKITSLSFLRNMGKIYNIYDLYKQIYKDEIILDNPSSGNPTSNNPTSKFK